MPPPPLELEAFLDLYRRFEYALKRAGFLHVSQKRASADWSAFADKLGDAFFTEVHDSGEAETLIAEPPRVRMRDSMAFEPAVPDPITNVNDLLRRGVCQVRHNYHHGEKRFTDASFDRDAALVREALRVLERAATRHKKVEELINVASEAN